MLQSEFARNILSVECISAIEKFQVLMKEKEQYVAHHVRIRLALTRHAASTSPVKSMNSNIKYTMGIIWYEFISVDMNSYQRVECCMNSYVDMNSYLWV